MTQLSLFESPPAPLHPEPEVYLYPCCTLFNGGSSDLYHIKAESKREAIAIAEAYLRSKGIVFRHVICCIGTYWRKSLDGYPCCPVERSRVWD